MIYLLDSNVLMTAHNNYYPIDSVPEFWEWLVHEGITGKLKMPIEMFEEVLDGGTDEEKDHLYSWVHDVEHKNAILLNREVNQASVQRIVDEGYAPDLSDIEIEAMGRDPFLIAYALGSEEEICIVTTEVSKPRKTRQNRRVPDVCSAFGIKSCNTFEMLRALKFSTGWRRAAN